MSESISISRTNTNGKKVTVLIRDEEWLKDHQKVLKKALEKLKIKPGKLGRL